MKTLRLLMLIATTMPLHGWAQQTYTISISPNLSRGPSAPDEDDYKFIQPATDAHDRCVGAIRQIPPEIENRNAIQQAWSDQCAADFRAAYKTLFEECDKQNADNRRWGQNTRSLINVFSSCTGETIERRRRMFNAAQSDAERNYRGSLQIVRDREQEKERIEREKQAAEAEKKRIALANCEDGYAAARTKNQEVDALSTCFQAGMSISDAYMLVVKKHPEEVAKQSRSR